MRSITILSFATVLLGCASLRAASQAPTVQEVTYLQPSSFAELCSTSDLVVVGRPDRSSVRLHRRPGTKRFEDQTVVTAWDIHVLDTVKTAAAPPTGSVRVMQYVGEAQASDGRKIRVDDAQFPPLTGGSTYVLFLRWSRALDGFEINFGPAGAYLFRGHQLEGRGNSPVAAGIMAQTLDELKSQVKACTTR